MSRRSGLLLVALTAGMILYCALHLRVGTDLTHFLPVSSGSELAALSGLLADSPLTRTGFVEITGTEATLAVPDPNTFDGDLRIMTRGSTEWTTIPATGTTAGRGLGVLDMARAIRTNAPHRAQGELAYHVLDTMVSINESMNTDTFVPVDSTATPAPPLPEGWDPTAATL